MPATIISMDLSRDISSILLYFIPALLIFVTAFFLIKKFLDNQHRLKIIEARLQTQKDMMPLRLQAYERLTLFLERISPNNILSRVYQPGLSVREFHIELLNTIRQEFEHNITQQIYVSTETWNVVRSAKEDVVKLINISAQTLDPNGKGAELNKKIFEEMMNGEETQVRQALDFLKKEVNTYY